jgi:hypothetical protein
MHCTEIDYKTVHKKMVMFKSVISNLRHSCSTDGYKRDTRGQGLFIQRNALQRQVRLRWRSFQLGASCRTCRYKR